MKRLLTTMALLCAIATIKSQSVPTDNVVAYYSFNGNANDVTGNGKNATVKNASLISDRLGKANTAYSFNGVNSMMYLPTNLLPWSTGLSVSFWFKSNGAGNFNGQTMVDFRGQYNFSVSVYTNHPTIQQAVLFNIAAPSPSLNCLTPNNTIQYGTWYHVVANYGNGVMSLYINGILKDSKTQSPANAVSGYYNTIGKDYHGEYDNRAWFYGAIDEVIIYKRGLTATEVLALYNRGLSSSEIPELFNKPDLQYAYDAIGRRTSRNAIVLKSAPGYISARDSADIEQAIDPGSVFEENVGNQKIVIYPNPTQGQLLVEIQGYEKETGSALYLFDLSGKLLLSKKPANNTMPLDLTSYPLGTYVLKIVLGDKMSEWKIIKE